MSFFDKLKGEAGIKDIKKEPEKKKPKKVMVEKSRPKKQPEKSIVPEKDLETEGELSIDLYETNGDIVVQSTIGGIKADDLDISIENDLVTIRGSRESKVEREGKKYFYQECYWGSFMRKVILPTEVDGSRTKAAVKDGVLTLTMPKILRKKKRKVSIQQAE